MAPKTKVISQLAEEILAEATADVERAKVAAVSPAAPPARKTEMAEQLLKVAAVLRDTNTSVTYADIQEFRKRYGV